ncbi:hypothetical protein HETIRDRAFT_157084 [Heterobasidion irregulare TC 32-1]|uniref:ATP-dependent DNA helicase II subunit 1 n=1 Tax=Heterobasidion irregulare (strain TC 32-1) TaxID=747525 RepID=W4KAB5_HETIT|nr:uncharacterized protein HETIRDRAFT_157084 [Heterobasidion irregulare TC 32-1]ETW82733.1 hypothetical protein HETIRDRAFT_157084 [Heterobasidion irregulare TC 32-1]
MAPYKDWNKMDEDEEDELQDTTYFESRRDVILFCIDCSESMSAPREHPKYEDAQTSHLLTALDAAVQIMKKKVTVGPNDSVGIMLYNTAKGITSGRVSDLKRGTFVHLPITTINAPNVLDLTRLVDEARTDMSVLREACPPLDDRCIPMGDVFTSCNWVLRDGAPKTASKRVFLITDNDDPHRDAISEKLLLAARTTLVDLVQAGVTVEPFFISTEDKPFDQTKFWTNVLLSSEFDDSESQTGSSELPESISITRIDDLLDQMRFHELPKRALFSVSLQLAPDFCIGVKGYGLVAEQRKGAYKYFADLGDRMEVAESRTAYVDEDRQAEVDKHDIVFGMTLGATGDDQDAPGGFGTRAVGVGKRVFYTADEVRSFRTLGLEPGIKLLGFKDRDDLAFEDNVRHSTFIYPDEMAYSGSKRTFSALVKTMAAKDKIGLALGTMRRNSVPMFYAMLPQTEKLEESGWMEPAGIHLVPLPFADDIRAAPVEQAIRAKKDAVDAAKAIVKKLAIKNGTYMPDSYPNPALAFHNEQLEATAFREEYEADSFEDVTAPNYDTIHKKAGPLIEAWAQAIEADEGANTTVVVAAAAGTKRAATVSVDEAEIRSKYESGSMAKLRVDQLKDFLRSKSLPVSGVKAALIERVAEWMHAH